MSEDLRLLAGLAVWCTRATVLCTWPYETLGKEFRRPIVSRYDTDCAGDLIPAFVDVLVRTTENFPANLSRYSWKMSGDFFEPWCIVPIQKCTSSSSPTWNAAIPSWFTCAAMALMRGSASATTLSCPNT